MIINKDGIYEVNSLFPNSDWINNGNYYILDETTDDGKDMANIYISNYPLVNFTNEDGFITEVTIIELEKPEEIEGKEIELTKNEFGEWEYIYVDIPLTPEQELELKVSNLEQENMMLMLATTEMYEEQYIENLNLMLAITELYEMNMEV